MVNLGGVNCFEIPFLSDSARQQFPTFCSPPAGTHDPLLMRSPRRGSEHPGKALGVSRREKPLPYSISNGSCLLIRLIDFFCFN